MPCTTHLRSATQASDYALPRCSHKKLHPCLVLADLSARAGLLQIRPHGVWLYFPGPFDNASVGGDASTVPREIELARRSARSYFGKRWFGFALLFLILNVMGSAFLGQVLVEDLIGQRPRYSVSSRIHDNALAQAVLHWLWSSH